MTRISLGGIIFFGHVSVGEIKTVLLAARRSAPRGAPRAHARAHDREHGARESESEREQGKCTQFSHSTQRREQQHQPLNSAGAFCRSFFQFRSPLSPPDPPAPTSASSEVPNVRLTGTAYEHAVSPLFEFACRYNPAWSCEPGQESSPR